MDLILWLYVAAIISYRLLELFYLKGRRGFLSGGQKDSTYYAIVVSFTIAMTMPAIEYAKYRQDLGIINLGIGLGLFLLAIIIRVKGLKALGGAFSPYIEKRSDRLVTTGIYAYIRHPLYLAVFLLTLGCTVFLKSPTGWLYVAMTFGAIMGRTKVEEAFLVANYDEYADYKERTWRLIPYVL